MRGPGYLLLVLASCTSFHEDLTSDSGVIRLDASVPKDAPSRDAHADAGAVSPFSVVLQLGDGGAFHAIWGSGAGDIHAVGDNGMLYDSDGGTWSPAAGTTEASMGGIWGNSATDIYAVGTLAAGGRGVILHNDGTGWVEQIDEAAGLNAVWGTGGASGTVYAVGYGGHFYTNTAGQGWVDPGHLPSDVCVTGQDTDEPILWSVWGNNSTFVNVAADVDTYFRYDGQTSWLYTCNPQDRTVSYVSVWGPPTSSASPSLFLGSNYYGVWWDEGTPTLLVLNEEKDAGAERASQYVWGIWGTASDSIVFVGDDGRIMSWNGGETGLVTWPSPSSVSLYGVWGTSLQDVWIVGDQGTILHGKIPQ
jgi:hypothetical protein